MEDLRQQIVRNLKNRVYGVSVHTAIRGIDNTSSGIVALRQLVSDGVVDVKTQKTPGGGHVQLYRCNPNIPKSFYHER